MCLHLDYLKEYVIGQLRTKGIRETKIDRELKSQEFARLIFRMGDTPSRPFPLGALILNILNTVGINIEWTALIRVN